MKHIVVYTFAASLLLSIVSTADANDNHSHLSTPIEKSANYTLPTSDKINQFLKQLAEQSEYAQIELLGHSAGKREIYTFFLSKNKDFLKTKKTSTNKPTVLIIASQHGNEPSGSEAVQKLIRDLVTDVNNPFLEAMNLVFVPMANPDGRDHGTRYNDAHVNPNIDYSILSQQETMMYVNLLDKFNPHIIYDIHESGIWKSVLSGKQGYQTNIQAQYEVANNPNIDYRIRTFSENVLLPQLIKETQKQGLPARHYSGELTYLQKPAARGGIGFTNFRNYSAMRGAFSVLVENRLDQKGGHFDTPRNIKQRISKQLKSVNAFLEVVMQNKKEIVSLSNQARDQWQSANNNEQQLKMQVAFQKNFDAPAILFPLTKIANQKNVDYPLANYNTITTDRPVQLPAAYLIKSHQELFKDILKKHKIPFEEINKNGQINATNLMVKTATFHQERRPGIRFWFDVEPKATKETVALAPGDLLVTTNQQLGTMAALFLDTRSDSSLYQEQGYSHLLFERKHPLEIFAVE